MKNIILCLIFCVSCVTTKPTLAEPERTMMYLQMINQSGFPVTVVQCIESKIDFTLPIKSQSQIDAMSAAAQACVNDFKDTDSGKRFMEFLKKQMELVPQKQEHVEVI